jgi:hypothetical protein
MRRGFGDYCWSYRVSACEAKCKGGEGLGRRRYCEDTHVQFTQDGRCNSLFLRCSRHAAARMRDRRICNRPELAGVPDSVDCVNARD